MTAAGVTCDPTLTLGVLVYHPQEQQWYAQQLMWQQQMYAAQGGYPPPPAAAEGAGAMAHGMIPYYQQMQAYAAAMQQQAWAYEEGERGGKGEAGCEREGRGEEGLGWLHSNTVAAIQHTLRRGLPGVLWLDRFRGAQEDSGTFLHV
jgi:hypothetical protein